MSTRASVIPGVELFVADGETSTERVFRESALYWRRSAEYWGNLARLQLEGKDFRGALFCARAAQDRLEWALADEARANALAQGVARN